MRFTPQFLDELKARLPVSEVVGQRVKLTRSGREFKGLSPFNKEKTPSFFVNDQKQAWFDFSSRQERQHLRFRHADRGRHASPKRSSGWRKWPAWRCRRSRTRTKQRDARRKTLHDVMELAAKFFEATLAARAGAKARGYLADRGLDPATQLKFRLGYATNERFALKEHLGSHGIPVEDMVEAGLLIAGDDIPVPYRPFPRPRDVSDHRPARAHHRLRRPRAGEGRAGEIPEFAGDAALSQRRDALQHRRRAPGRA